MLRPAMRKPRPPIRLNPGLPTPLAASLGRMIARHSYLELTLATALYRLAGVSHKVGRVAIANPRGSDILNRMLELAEIFELKLHPFPWNQYKSTLDDLKKRRDIFAHSAWVYNRQVRRYFLYVTSGKSQPKEGAPGRSRKIHPEGVPASIADLRTLRKEIEKAIGEAETLDRFVQLSLQVRAHSAKKSVSAAA